MTTQKLAENVKQLLAEYSKHGQRHKENARSRRGDAKPGRKLLRAMGLRKAFTDKKTTAMKFEDITN